MTNLRKDLDASPNIESARQMIDCSMRCHEASHCKDCKNMLVDIIDEIERSRDLEEDYLSIWAQYVQENKSNKECKECLPPQWSLRRTQLPV